MPTVADSVDAVVAGDTHVDTTSLCATTPVGAVIDQITIDNDEEGFEAAIGWVLRVAPSARLVIGLEGTRSYGAGLTRALQAVGLTVVEVERPSRGERGRRGKSDPGDALLAARKVLAMDVAHVPQPRTGDGVREALRLLTIGREGMVKRRVQQANALLAVLLTGNAEQQALRKDDLTAAVLRRLARSRVPAGAGIEQQVRVQELRRAADEIQRLDQQLRDNEKQLRAITSDVAPQLLERTGVGPIGAAQLIVSYSHHGRCRDEAAFAALAGVNPIPASSGRITRHRLNRGGDRRLNRTLHVVAMTRARHDPRTREYIERHQTDKTNREIRRLLKRYIARELFNVLTTIEGLDPNPKTENKINNAT